jgi:hypothetical protein
MQTRFRTRTFHVVHEPELRLGTVGEAADVVPLLRAIFSELDADKEHFVVVAIDCRLRISGYKVVGTGTLTACLVHPRELFAARSPSGRRRSMTSRWPGRSRCRAESSFAFAPRSPTTTSNASSLMPAVFVATTPIDLRLSFDRMRTERTDQDEGVDTARGDGEPCRSRLQQPPQGFELLRLAP